MTIRQAGPSRARLVKGSHIVVKRLFDHDSAYIFQNPDGRVVFAIPFANDFTLIGTTDEDFKGDVNSVAPSAEEIKYLCEAAMEYFRQAVSPDDVVWTFAGVRALYDDGSRGREDHARLSSRSRQALWRGAAAHGVRRQDHDLSAAGRSGVAKLSHFFAGRPAWTSHAPLPGRRFPGWRVRGMAGGAGGRGSCRSSPPAGRSGSAGRPADTGFGADAHPRDNFIRRVRRACSSRQRARRTGSRRSGRELHRGPGRSSQSP